MARTKKTNSGASALPNSWWKWKEEEYTIDDVMHENSEEIIIYTSEKIKIKLEPFGLYFYPNGDNAFQYKVKSGSKEHKELFKLLNLTGNDEKKSPRKKRVKEGDV